MQFNTILLQEAAQGGAGLMNILMIVAIIVIFYFFMIRPQQKRQKDIKNFRESVKVGDRIVTAGGIHGKVKAINDTTFDINIAKDLIITVDRGSVYPSAQAAAQDPAKAQNNA